MPYVILNDVVAPFADEAEPDSLDFAILGSQLSSVLTGCGVTSNGTNMNLSVAAGLALVNGLPVVVAGGTAVIGAASANPRWDLVYIDSAGAVQVMAGTPASVNPVLPTTFDPAVQCLLAAVYIPTSTSALTANNLLDKRRQKELGIQRVFADGTGTMLLSKVSGDTTNRIKIDSVGKITWTPGNAGTPAPALAFDATLAGLLHTGKLGTTPSVASEVPLTVTAAGSQTADLLQLRSSAPAVLTKVDANGILSAPNFKRGTGTPEGSITGNVGDLYAQTDGANGATLWVKESGVGNTGWHACGTTSAGLILGGGMCPTGTVVEYAGTVLPNGWLWCDGSAVSRSTFANLFAAISTDWGAGNGSTTFNVPDKRGLVTAGASNFGGNGSVGGNGKLVQGSGGIQGEAQHQLLGAEVGVHNHTATDAGHLHLSHKRDNLGTTPYVPSAPNPPFEVEYIQGAAGFGNTEYGFASVSIGFNAGGGFHNNVQPTVSSRYIVKI